VRKGVGNRVQTVNLDREGTGEMNSTWIRKIRPDHDDEEIQGKSMRVTPTAEESGKIQKGATGVAVAQSTIREGRAEG